MPLPTGPKRYFPGIASRIGQAAVDPTALLRLKQLGVSLAGAQQFLAGQPVQSAADRRCLVQVVLAALGGTAAG